MLFIRVLSGFPLKLENELTSKQEHKSLCAASNDRNQVEICVCVCCSASAVTNCTVQHMQYESGHIKHIKLCIRSTRTNGPPYTICIMFGVRITSGGVCTLGTCTRTRTLRKCRTQLSGCTRAVCRCCPGCKLHQYIAESSLRVFCRLRRACPALGEARPSTACMCVHMW